MIMKNESSIFDKDKNKTCATQKKKEMESEQRFILHHSNLL